MLASLTLFASILLHANDGTPINVNYATQRQDQAGSSRETWIARVSLELGVPGKNTTAVIVGRCGGIGSTSFTYAVSCAKPENSSRIDLTSACRVDADAADVPVFVRSTLPQLRFLGSFREGRTEECSYELAVVRDGQWLVDPINGTHNFQLGFRP